jgi:hypothetical protein
MVRAASTARSTPAASTARSTPAASTTRSTLSRRDIYNLLRRALAVSLGRTNFRIVHLALVASRLELVVEADDKVALARGMQGFQVSAARAFNRAARRRGTVFPDRYRMRVLATRALVRDAIGRLPPARDNIATRAWPQTWLLRVELGRTPNRASERRASPPTRAPTTRAPTSRAPTSREPRPGARSQPAPWSLHVRP